MTERPHCLGLKSSGDPCGSTFGLSPAGLCFNHDPDRREISRETKAAGGRAAGAAKRAARTPGGRVAPEDVPPPPKNLEDAVRYFAWITHAVATGRLDARTGHEAAYALNGFKAAAEKRDLEREIAELRKELADAKRRTVRAS